MAKISAKKTLIVFKLLFTVFVLFFLIERIHLGEIRSAFHHANFLLIGVAAALLPLNIYCQYKKWETLVRQHVKAPGKEILLSLLAGFTMGIVTPARVGEYARVLFIRDNHRISLVGLTLIDKLYTLSIVFSTGLIAIILYFRNTIHPLFCLFLLFMTTILFFLLYRFLGNPQGVKTLLHKKVFENFFSRHEKLEEFVRAVDYIETKPAKTLRIFSLLLVLTFTFQFNLLIMAFSSIKFTDSLITAFAILTTKIFFPYAIGDLGVRESIAIFYLHRYQVVAAAAFDASLLLFLINILIPALLGLVLLLKSRLNEPKS